MMYTSVSAEFVTDDARMLSNGGFDVRLVDDCASLRRLFAEWHAFRPDVVVSWFANRCSLGISLACKIRGIPHHCILSGYDTSNLPDIGYGSLRPGWRRWYTIAVFRLSSSLLPVSTTADDALRKNTGHRFEWKTRLIEHSIPPLPWQSKPRNQVVVSAFYATDSERVMVKGFDRLIALAERLPNIEFAHVGGIPESLSRCLPANLVACGPVDNATLRDLLFTSAMYIQPSRYESFGFAAAEASWRAAGLPFSKDQATYPS